MAGDASDGWRTPYVIVMLLLGVLLIGAFIYWEHIFSRPLMPLFIWKDKNFCLVRVYPLPSYHSLLSVLPHMINTY